MTSNKSRSHYHPDILIFLIAIPVINAINFHLTYANIQFNLFFLTRFIIDLLQGYLAWWIVREQIIYLDRKLNFATNTPKRIGIQILLTTVTGVFIIAVTTEILSLLIKKEFAPLDFYTQDLLIISIWFLVINGFYIGMYFYKALQKSAVPTQEETGKNSGLVVKTGNNNLLIRFPEIRFLIVDGEYVQLIDLQGKRYYLDNSLDKLEKSVPPHYFFRINRQVLAHRDALKGFKRIENGKLLIQLSTPDLPLQDLTVSRTKAPAFRAWFLP